MTEEGHGSQSPRVPCTSLRDMLCALWTPGSPLDFYAGKLQTLNWKKEIQVTVEMKLGREQKRCPQAPSPPSCLSMVLIVSTVESCEQSGMVQKALDLGAIDVSFLPSHPSHLPICLKNDD